MGKKGHKWHCGKCHSDCLSLRKSKGTKYIFCPNCQQVVAYHNVLPLIAALPSALKMGKKMLGGMGGASPQTESIKSQRSYVHKVNQPILVDID